jgi:hypothetical protein
MKYPVLYGNSPIELNDNVPQRGFKRSAVQMVTNSLFGTTPGIVHANGPFKTNLYWEAIKRAFFNSRARNIGPSDDVTVITCNNGHPSMGVFERSLDHLGVPYLVLGETVSTWVNAIHKPRAILDGLRQIKTEFALYADSRDALLLTAPDALLSTYQREFQNIPLVFGADRVNYPPNRQFKLFEEYLEGAQHSPFKYLNSGMWIGATEFCLRFFERVVRNNPVAEGPESDQGLVRQLLPEFQGAVVLDYECKLFQNIGFLNAPILILEKETE